MENNSNFSIGPVSLTVIDLKKVTAFYTGTLGLQTIYESPGRITLGAGERSLLTLVENPQATYNRRWPGLYHIAYLLPDRFNLARLLYQLVERQVPLQGAADHGVSEAIYLADPEGNGIELYRDRPRDEWPYDDAGQVAMVSDPLNLEQLLFELKGHLEPWRGIHTAAKIGHLHLQVSDIQSSVEFYTAILGFELQQRFGSQAAFMSMYGYHHHIGANNWNSKGVSPAPENAAGLREFELTFADRSTIGAIHERAGGSAIAFEDIENGIKLKDPSGNSVLIHS